MVNYCVGILGMDSGHLIMAIPMEMSHITHLGGVVGGRGVY